MNFRMLPPNDPNASPVTVNGRTYSGMPGVIQTLIDCDATVLAANKWTFISLSGPTSARPTGKLGLYPAVRGTKFFDETLGALIEYDGANWISVNTGGTV